ncbi:MAG TPA: hypothetical protein VM094_06530 [Gemmatimonadales bacterium]|nr:hypothetical protein [Gemmatimonadales bacterium]
MDWYISELRGNSAHLAADPEVRGKVRVDERALDEALSIVHVGFDQLRTKAAIPAHFSDTALEAAGQLAAHSSNGVSRIEIALGGRRVEVTQNVEANVGEVTKEKFRSMGSLEGTIESLTIHGLRRFTLYERQWGRGVQCFFDFDEHEIFNRLWNKRVLVRGIIWSRADGRPIKIQVSKPEDIYTFPPDDELPTASQVRGILGNG